MANWLLDYIEMTEYIPAELREQLTSIRELDLQVHNAMDELEKDIKQFFSEIDSLTLKERQEKYEALMKKCDVATKAASDKVKVADKLHDLVEKSMRLLDQGLEKLKEELLEGDKAYIVEDLERRSQELDEHENSSQRQTTSKSQMLKAQSRGSNNNNHHHHRLSSVDSSSSKSNQSISQSNHRNSMPAQSNNNNNLHTSHNHHLTTNHRNRNNSTGTQNSTGPQKKRERKRLNSAMTIFNRNSRIDDEDSTTSQSFVSSPLTPDYIVSMQQNSTNKSLNDAGAIVGGNNCGLTLKGMVTGNRISISATDKSNGKDPLAAAKQPILTAIDAAHAVSPNATNSDKLVLFSNNSNGDNYDATLHHNLDKQQQQHHQNNTNNPLGANPTNPSIQQQQQLLQNHNQLSTHLLSKVGLISGDSTLINNSIMQTNKGDTLHSHSESSNHKTSSAPFSNLPLSSRHDPIMMAASQAINATQNMTSGRRTSSLKASYAAVNSGRLQTSAPSNHQLFGEPGVGLVHEVYCKCRSHIQGSDMIACDNSNCKIEWFHWQCVGITTPPEGEWYCDECRVSLGVHTQRSNKQPKLEGVNVT